MRFFGVLLMVSVTMGCAETTSSHEPRSPDDETNEELGDPQRDDSNARAEANEDGDDENTRAQPRPAKKRRPKRRKHVEVAPEPEPPPVARKPPPPPVEPPPEETAAVEPVSADQGGEDALEAEARKRCRWKNVPPYRPEWASSISPPLPQQRKITSKPICPYGTPAAVLRVARQIAVHQTKGKR